MSATYIWLIASCVLFALEMLTGGFALMAFALASLCAALGAALGMGLEGQIIGFSVVSLLFFFFIRPFLLKWWKKHEKEAPHTNAMGLIGKTARVVETIDMSQRKGRVVIDGDNFMAVSADGSIIEKDTIVKIVGINSTILEVKPADLS